MTPKMTKQNWPTWTVFSGLWLVLLLIPLLNRTVLPVDETRYLAVAWEMWNRGDWLVPYLNGEAYHHKPPLLFWLIHLGWTLFGVNEWWPRLVPGFFSLGSLFLSAHLARQLWPQHPQIAQWVPLILLSFLWWSLFTSAIMFDLVLAFFTLLGMVALVKKSWGWLGIAIGLGVLTKGPVILLHLLPVALLAPIWQRTRPFPWQTWYLGLLGSILLGALIALAWAIPAAIVGGEAFREAIFWGQTANRLVNSFAHQHPFWWYLPLLPVILFPWLLWLPLWRGLLQLPQHIDNSGIRFCLIWFILVFIGFSLVSGKQLHYLLPTLPAFALLTAYLIVKLPTEQQHQRWDTVLPGLVIILAGLLLLIAPYLASTVRVPFWITQISSLPAFILILFGILLIVSTLPHIKYRLILLSTTGILFSLCVPLSIIRAAGQAYDLHDISQYINTLFKRGQTVVHFGEYHGQFQFLGRLQQPLPVIDEYNLCPWLTQHPDGKLVIYFSGRYQDLSQQADYVQNYRSKQVGILDAHFMYSACTKWMLYQ